MAVSLTSTFAFNNRLSEIIKTKLNIDCRVLDASNKNGITSSLYISKKEDIKKFLDWIYKDAELFLKRKHEIYTDFYNLNNSLTA